MAVSHDGCNCYGRGLDYLRYITVDRHVTTEAVAKELAHRIDVVVCLTSKAEE